MKIIKLKEILAPIFSKSQIDLINPSLANVKLGLKEVNSIIDFVADCEAETVNFKVAGEHRQSDWESGWSGSGVYYSNDDYNNLPYYFKNNTHIRVGDKVFEDCLGFAEVNLLRALQCILFKDQLAKFGCSTVFEYGCGTGSNISFLRNNIQDLDFYGADWVGSACKKLIDNKILPAEKVRLVNYFDPNTFCGAPVPYVAFTNASLEQSGDRYKSFISYLVSNEQCRGGIHIEPIRELLDLNNPLNIQSFKYAERRGYLTGFYEYVKSLNIELLISKDFGIGSKYINGYQVICWRKYD